MAKVFVIPPITEQLKEYNKNSSNSKKRVCAYCRVSSDSDKQLDSYDMQVKYYSELIKNNPVWDYMGIYSDEGISGTNTSKRDGFNSMISDCENGLIDTIITKSISRFARNTIDCLQNIRKLKALGVTIYFEKENINTMDEDGELMLSILSSFAQDESRNISENIRWSVQRRFQTGTYKVQTHRFLGFFSDQKGNLVPDENEAGLIIRIFNEYAGGKSARKIAEELTNEGIKTVTGKTTWNECTIRNILSNEKYYGSVIFQKTYVIDFINHKKIFNKGEKQKYFIKNNHEAIISEELFEMVKEEKVKRAAAFGNTEDIRGEYNNRYAFSGKIICHNCGNTFKRRTWNSKLNSKQIVWQCNTYIKHGKDCCDMKALDDITLKKVFVRIFNRLMQDSKFKKVLLNNIKNGLENKEKCKANPNLDKKYIEIKDKIQELIRLHLKNKIDEQEFKRAHGELSSTLESMKIEKESIFDNIKRSQEIRQHTEEVEKVIYSRKQLLAEFDDKIFNALVEKIEVISPMHLCFILKNGLKIEEKFEKKKGINGLV